MAKVELKKNKLGRQGSERTSSAMRKGAAPQSPSPGALSCQIKITLEEIEPPIWRRLVLPVSLSLGALHGAIQAAMGWAHSHMHQFHVGENRYGDRDLLDAEGFDCEDEAEITVADVARSANAFFYEYDFGDGWMHRIEFERAPNPEGAMARPVCTDGARACPPEDVGGSTGYEDFLEALADPKHEMHEEYTQWIGGTFDPATFDVRAANDRLARAFPEKKRRASAALKAGPAARARQDDEASPEAVAAMLPFQEETDRSEDERARSASREGPEAPGPPPTLDEWRRLYAAAAAFKGIEAWQWMWDSNLFGVQNPEDGQTGYCCVMGSLGHFRALAVYRGAAGLAFWRRIQIEGGKKHPDPELFVGQDCLMASWESRSDLDAQDLGTLRRLGLKFRGAQAWPLFREHLPGYCPWHLSERQARFLACALEQAREVALRFREDPKALAPKGDRLLVRVFQNARGEGAWEDRWLPPEPEPAPRPVSEPLDEIRLKRIEKGCERVDGAWMADRFHVLAPVADRHRPFYPALFLVMDAAFHIIVGQGMDHPRDGIALIRAHLLDAMEASGAFPGELWVKRTEVAECLRPLAERLGIGLRLKKSLRELDAARKELERMLAMLP